MELTLEEARSLVVADLNGPDNDSGEDLVVLDGETMTKPYGWIFFYQSRRFVESADSSAQLAGNGPIVVLRGDASIHYLGSSEEIDETIRMFEEENGLK